MKFSDYLDQIEGTLDEDLFREKLENIREEIDAAGKIPVVGKLLLALVDLADSESIDAFRQTASYELLKNWNIDPKAAARGDISFYPSDETLKKIAMCVGAIFAIIGLIVIIKKFCCKRKIA